MWSRDHINNGYFISKKKQKKERSANKQAFRRGMIYEKVFIIALAMIVYYSFIVVFFCHLTENYVKTKYHVNIRIIQNTDWI